MNAPDPANWHLPALLGNLKALKYLPQMDGPHTVVRVPVVGPAPFNTLAYARTRVTRPSGSYIWGQTAKESVLVPTPVAIAEYDPQDSRQQTVRHSTTAALRAIETTREWDWQNDAGSSFTIAANSIEHDVHIGPDGLVSLTVNFEWRFDDRTPAGSFLIDLSTWMLLYEARGEAHASEDWWRGGRMRTPDWIPPTKGLARKPSK